MTECRYYEMCDRRASIRSLPRRCDARHCWMFRPMPDVDALLALAEVMEGHASDVSAGRNYVDSRDLNDYARRIREAIGATDEDN